MYKILALIGEAGAGKDYILHLILQLNKFERFKETFPLHEIISCTSRPVREGEKEGVNYYYYTDKEF